MKLPVVANPCPADGHTQRAYVKNLIRQINLDHPEPKTAFSCSITWKYPRMADRCR